MTIEEIDTFLRIADIKSVTKVAEDMYITTQGVRKRIKKLEDELGAKLFERLPREMKLTPFGQFFYDEAKPIVRYVEELSGSLERFDRKMSRTMRVGIPQDIPGWSERFKAICEDFEKEHPQYSVKFFEDKLLRNRKQLEDGELDVAIVPNKMGEKKYVQLLAFEREYLLVMGRTHPLAHKKEITDEDILNELFIFAGPETYMEEYLKSIGAKSANMIYVQENRSIRELSVENGFALSFSGADVLTPGAEPPKDICYKRFLPPHIVDYYFTASIDNMKKEVVKRFFEYLEDKTTLSL